MKLLPHLKVLLLGANHSELELLLVWLQSEGARVVSADWEQGFVELKRQCLNVVVMDLRQSGESAAAFLGLLREDEATCRVPVFALSDKVGSDGDHDARIDKYLTAPLHPATLAGALADLPALRPSIIGASAPSREELMASLIEARSAASDIKAVTRLLNATGPFRFTSIIRLEGVEQPTSIWTYDRENPELNSPREKHAIEPYCARVRETNAPLVLPDAASDSAVANHPAELTVLSFCGVPLLRSDGSFYGTLCSYDIVPRFVPDATVQRLQDALVPLRKHWSELVSSAPSG